MSGSVDDVKKLTAGEFALATFFAAETTKTIFSNINSLERKSSTYFYVELLRLVIDSQADEYNIPVEARKVLRSNAKEIFDESFKITKVKRKTSEVEL